MPSATLPVTQFTEIVVATDFDQPSDRALALAKSIAHRFSSEIVAIHVTLPVIPMATAGDELLSDNRPSLCAQEQLEAYGDALRLEGFKARTLCPWGAIADQIIQAAEQNHASLVVVGTHARLGLHRLLSGSHAETLARRLNIPLLIVGPKAVLREGTSWRPTNILCASSMDREGAWVAAYTHRLATELASQWEIACNYLPEEVGEYADWKTFQSTLQNQLPRANGRPPEIRSVFLHGPLVDSLVDLTHSRDADLLVLGNSQRFMRSPRLHAGTLPRVLAEALCPVLLLPAMQKPIQMVHILSKAILNQPVVGGL